MALTINTNISSLMVQLSLKQSSLELDRALQQMTTGYRINSAKDDAAGYAVATKMAIDLSSYNVVQNNTLLGTSLLNTATSSLDLVTTHLQRIRDLAEQAANGTYGTDSITAIQAEIDQRTQEINRVMSSTEYNGIKLFEGDAGTVGGTGGGATTVDESKRVINQTTFQSGQTYYITTSDDLVKLQDLVNSGVDTTNVTFELMSDINMQGVAFRGIGNGGADGSDMSKMFKGSFNGNQHVISNLAINTSEDDFGLFVISMGDINSVGLENVNITGGNVAGLVLQNMGNINSCYVTGDITSNGDEKAIGGLVGMNAGNISRSYSECDIAATGEAFYVGGLTGVTLGGIIDNCYSLGNVSGNSSVAYCGGLLGSASNIMSQPIINNSYSGAEVSNARHVGGFIAINIGSASINNCYTNSIISGSNPIEGAFIGYCDSNLIINNSYYDSNKNDPLSSVGSGVPNGTITGVVTTQFENLIAGLNLPNFAYGGGITGGGNSNNTGREFTLQVGIDSTENSKITFDTALGFTLNIDVSTTANAQNALDEIDEVLDLITAKQFGAVQNRLDSVLDSLNVSIQNTTSSLSTVRDADIAKVSADYIRAQILQQASASLLATANQAPSIALNLI